ncbi:MAG: hypothetical protein KG003_03615 [Bacteroidetes bacterium]|nr:hypothetical protein [Bacteroidota bacterium]
MKNKSVFIPSEIRFLVSNNVNSKCNCETCLCENCTCNDSNSQGCNCGSSCKKG